MNKFSEMAFVIGKSWNYYVSAQIKILVVNGLAC
jgi:hypothetical protein